VGSIWSGLWLYVVMAIAGIAIFAVICGLALLVMAGMARLYPRLLGLPADGDAVLFWAEEPSMVDKADLLHALGAQCDVKTVTEGASGPGRIKPVGESPLIHPKSVKWLPRYFRRFSLQSATERPLPSQRRLWLSCAMNLLGRSMLIKRPQIRQRRCIGLSSRSRRSSPLIS
jgi:hypothetical protein